MCCPCGVLFPNSSQPPCSFHQCGWPWWYCRMKEGSISLTTPTGCWICRWLCETVLNEQLLLYQGHHWPQMCPTKAKKKTDLNLFPYPLDSGLRLFKNFHVQVAKSPAICLPDLSLHVEYSQNIPKC